MGLILCPQNNVAHPLYIADLGVHIRSIEELCYVIYQYPLLVMDDFVDDGFMEFISDDLKLSDYLHQMEKAGGRQPDTDELLCGILEYSELYKKGELAAYREKIRSMREMRTEEYALCKADFMFEISRYGQAIRYYNKALRSYGDGTGPSFASAAVRAATGGESRKALLSRLYESIGDAQANLMLYREAYDNYSQANAIDADSRLRKKIYFLSLIDPTVQNRKLYAAYLGEDIEDSWGEEYDAAVRESTKGTKGAELDAVFDRDMVKKRRAVTEILGRWKQEYRRML